MARASAQGSRSPSISAAAAGITEKPNTGSDPSARAETPTITPMQTNRVRSSNATGNPCATPTGTADPWR